MKFKHEDGVDKNRSFRLSAPKENEFHMQIMTDEIRSLRNQEYWILRPSGDVREKIENSKQLHNILKEQFDIQITETESPELARDFIPL